MGKQILQLLNRKPVKAIPVILIRIDERLREYEITKQNFLKDWDNVCEKNFHKSLDYRSLSFKQHEKKQQNSKAYMTDIKNLANNAKISNN